MKVFFIFLTIVLASLFYFPVILPWLLPVNTKLILAVVGLVVFVLDLARYGKSQFDENLTKLIILSIVVSIIGLFSVIYNNTFDYAYSGYVFSMLVWFAAAYFIVRLIQTIHGHVDLRLITNYLVAVCVMQCAAAIANDNFPAFKQFVDTHVEQGQDFINNLNGIKRKYGIGANLDTAGIRFSVVLCMIAVVVSQLVDNIKHKWLWLYMLSFLFICVEGNIIARTTSVGMGLALVYIIFNIKSYKTASTLFNQRIILTTLSFGAVFVFFMVYMYNTDVGFAQNLRFGFEGIFSLFETGKWEVASNERLFSMYVWPDNAKTWLIGDGYFSNPINTDPYFTDEVTGGYYMGTDVGFLRFIYYFGVIGLTTFASFFILCGKICSKYYPNYKLMMWMFVLLNYLIWFKVSTDIFLIFALFIAAHMISEIPASAKPSKKVCT